VPGSGRNETVLESLILKQANNSRLSDRCSAEDCDVLEDGVVVGRMFKVPVPLQDRPWMWASRHNGEIRRAAPLRAHKRRGDGCMGAFTLRVRGILLYSGLHDWRLVLRELRPLSVQHLRLGPVSPPSER
jgi:hypothetical protein